MSDNSEYAETINCLNQTFSVSDNVIRSSAEKRLKELGNFKLNFSN